MTISEAAARASDDVEALFEFGERFVRSRCGADATEDAVAADVRAYVESCTRLTAAREVAEQLEALAATPVMGLGATNMLSVGADVTFERRAGT